MKTQQTPIEPLPASDLFSDVVDGIIAIPHSLLALLWGGIVFLLLTPFVFVVAGCSSKEKQVRCGYWLRDRVRVAMRGIIQ